MKKNSLYLFGLGAMTFLGITSFFIIVEDFLRHVQMFLNAPNAMIFWTTETLIIFLYIFLTWLTINLIQKFSDRQSASLKKLFVMSVGVYCVLQAFQFLYTYYVTDYVLNRVPEEHSAYFNYLRQDIGFYGTATSLFGILKVLAFAATIYLFIRRQDKNSISYLQDIESRP